MSATALERRPMPLAEYLALPEATRAEWVDGVAIMSPAPAAPHQRTSRRVANVVEAGCPGLFVVCAVGYRVSPTRYRIPDVMATTMPFEEAWATEAPVLVAEVLSPGTRTEDTVRKSHEYASAGVGHYWLVDRERRTLTALSNNGDGWDVALELTTESPRGSVTLGTHGTVALDLDALLAV